MKLTAKEFYDEYMRVLENGELDQMDSLLEATLTNKEYFNAARKVELDYAKKHGIEDSPLEKREIKLKLITNFRRVFMGQKPR